MDIRKVKKIIELFEGSSLTEMEISEGEDSVKLSRGGRGSTTNMVYEPQHFPSIEAAPVVTNSQTTDEAPTGEKIESPMVGTFYATPSENEPPYVKVGSRIKKGDVLCIIEAMKTFNQIEAEISGVVTHVLHSNGDPVEYGEALFIIDPA